MASRSVSRASIAHNSARLNPLVRCNLKRLAAEGACRRRLVATLRRAARQHHLLGIDTVVAADTRAHETRPATVLGDDGLDADRDAQGHDRAEVGHVRRRQDGTAGMASTAAETFQRLNDRGRLRARGWRPVYPPILSEALQAAGGFQMPRSCIIATCRSITSRLYSRCLPG